MSQYGKFISGVSIFKHIRVIVLGVPTSKISTIFPFLFSVQSKTISSWKWLATWIHESTHTGSIEATHSGYQEIGINFLTT